MSKLPSAMKAAVLYGAEDVRMEKIPVPKIGPGDVLLKIEAALTCGTDAKVYRRGGHPTMIKPPSPFGHEFAGVVAAVGENVADFKPGQRVVAANSAPCGQCRYCKLGRESLCTDILYINGAYAEYIAIPARIVAKNLLEIPDHLSFTHAALTEPLACVLHGVAESHLQPGDTAAVLGAGPIGLFFVKLCKMSGARVISVDVLESRLEVARRLGADEAILATPETDAAGAVCAMTAYGEGADVAIDATGSEKVWETALKMVRKGGLANLFGGCAPGTSIHVDTELLHYSELTIKGVYHHTPYFIARALDLLASGDMQAHEFITAEFPLSKVDEALRLILTQQGVKSAVLPGRSK